MNTNEIRAMKLSRSQTNLLLDAYRDKYKRVYQSDYQTNGTAAPHSASAFTRSCQALVRRSLMVNVSSVGVFELTVGGNLKAKELQTPCQQISKNLG